jgi:hypothetical protein
MNKTIIIKEDKRLECDSFLIIRPKSNYYKKGEKYTIVNQEQFFKKMSYLKSVETFSLKDLPEQYIFLADNYPKSLFLEIQKEVYKAHNKLTLQDYPQFLLDIKKELGKETFQLLEPEIYKTFKPMTLLEIMEVYKETEYYNEKSYIILKGIIRDAYVEKKVSVLVFSNRAPESEIIERLNQNF